MKAAPHLGPLGLAILVSHSLFAQSTTSGPPSTAPAPAQNPWAYNVTVDGYIVPDGQSYVNPVLTADHNWLHLEARYNYENLRTGSVWIGYNFSAGKNLVLNITPMIGGVFGRTNGIAPGFEASLTYKKVALSISNEYVFDTGGRSGNFYYSWPQLTYSPLKWLRVGLVAQRTKAFHTTLDVQRGFLLGVSHKQWEFTTYVFNLGFTEPTVVLEAGVNF
jgi:hypothetical protein